MHTTGTANRHQERGERRRRAWPSRTAVGTATACAAREAMGEAAQRVLRAGEIVLRLPDAVAQRRTGMRIDGTGPLVAGSCAPAPTSNGVSATGSVPAVPLDYASDAAMALVDRARIRQAVATVVREAAEAFRGRRIAEPPSAGRSRADADISGAADPVRAEEEGAGPRQGRGGRLRLPCRIPASCWA